MKKSVLALLLAAISTGAMAEWVFLEDFFVSKSYYDPSSIVKNGNLPTVWMVDDRQNKLLDAQSLKTKHEIDCAGKSLRTIVILSYDGHMGTGKMLRETTPLHQWFYIQPGEPMEAVWKAACGKR